MREIILTRGKVALVDDADYVWLSAYKWTAAQSANSGKFYAYRQARISPGGRFRPLNMARAILGLRYGDKRQADHRDHDTLNNQRANLRIVTNAQNKEHQPSRKASSSSFVGVHWSESRKKWCAQIQIDKRVINLGRFDTELEAAAARDAFVMSRGSYHERNLADHL